MLKCPICGTENALKRVKTEYKAFYGFKVHSTELNSYECSCCGANLDLDYEEQNELAIKEASSIARKDCVSEILEELEKTNSFVEIERSLYLPPKTLSKWKNQSKAPSAAAAALVSLLGVFPWLSYVGMANFNPDVAYKIAGAAFFEKATESEKIKAFYSSSDNYDFLGLMNDKTVVCNKTDIIRIPDSYSLGSQTSSVQEIL